MLTPVDLETTIFRRCWRGYNTKEVQEFMNRIIHDYEYIYRENIDMKEKIDELNAKLDQYQLIEENLRNAVILAQKTAEDVKNAAEQEAQILLKDARQRSEDVKQRIKTEIQTEIQNLALLRNQVEFFKCQFKSFLSSLIEIAENQIDFNMVWQNVKENLPANQIAQAEAAASAAAEPAPTPAPPMETSEIETVNQGVDNRLDLKFDD